MVVSTSSIHTWSGMKVALLTHNKVLRWPCFIPKAYLYIVVQVDLGQGSTKLSLRLLNVPHARSPQNLDLLCIFEAPQTFGNLPDTCSSLFHEIMALHQTWWQHNATWTNDYLVFWSSNDDKITSTLHTHARQLAKFFNAYDYATLDHLVKGQIPGGWIMKKYVPFAFPFPFPTFRFRGIEASKSKTQWGIVLSSKIKILQGVRHPIPYLGVCYANDPPKGGGGGMVFAPALDLTTSL